MDCYPVRPSSRQTFSLVKGAKFSLVDLLMEHLLILSDVWSDLCGDHPASLVIEGCHGTDMEVQAVVS